MTYDETCVRLSDLIVPSFYEVYRQIEWEGYTHYWLKGGRGSTKSSFVSLMIILGMLKNPEANAVVIRKVGLYLKDSVFEQLIWAIEKLKVSDLWQTKVSPPEMCYKKTGQKILFRGADNPRKLKSTKVSKGYVRYIWYEEADEFSGEAEIRNMNQSLMRGGSKYDVFYTYNPPRSQRHWINRAVLNPRKDQLVHSSTYQSVPARWLGEQFLIEAEQLSLSNKSRYEHEYLGKATGCGSEVFTNVTVRKISEEEMARFDRIYRGIDWGYGADPFCYGAMYYNPRQKRLYIFYEYYKTGAKFDAIERVIKAENVRGEVVTAESAEPRSNDELRDRGIRIRKAKKGPGSVEFGICWLQNLEEIVIDPDRCPNTAREFLEYELEKDTAGNFREGFPDRNNHSIDMVRYALEDVMKKPSVSILR